MTLDQGDVRLLGTELAERLLTSTIPARYAYTALDGTPRIVSSWFVWTGEELVLPTFISAPHISHAAYRVRALRANPDVAVSIDTDSNGNRIVGQLHTPDETQSGERLPGVVVVGPASSVKGQVPTIYAARLAELGYAALAFDHSTYGESEGWPRSDEDPFAKIEDVKNAVTFLAGHEKIDAARLAAVGVCAGGGYAPAAAVADRHIKVLATVSGLPDLRATIEAAGDWQSIMVAAQNAREEYARSSRPVHIPFLADGELDVWRENGKKFYLTDRNKDPIWRNQTLLWSYDKMIQFSAIDTADLLAPTPLLVIAGSQAETLDQSERLYERAQGVKEFHLIEGGTHFDFYDRAQYVGPAVTKINEFLTNHL